MLHLSALSSPPSTVFTYAGRNKRNTHCHTVSSCLTDACNQGNIDKYTTLDSLYSDDHILRYHRCTHYNQLTTCCYHCSPYPRGQGMGCCSSVVWFCIHLSRELSTSHMVAMDPNYHVLGLKCKNKSALYLSVVLQKQSVVQMAKPFHFER